MEEKTINKKKYKISASGARKLDTTFVSQMATINEYINNNESDVFNNSNVNLINIGFDQLARNPYAKGGQQTIQSLMFLAQDEAIYPVNILEYYIDIAIKNNGFLSSSTRQAIKNTFYIIPSIYQKGSDVFLREEKEVIADSLNVLCNKAFDMFFYSSVYGGCYIVADEQLKIFSPQELMINGEHFFSKVVPSKPQNNFSFNNNPEVRQLNEFLLAKSYKLVSNERLGEMASNLSMDRLIFNDNEVNVLLDKVFLMNSLFIPTGRFTKQLLHGINLSMLEGKTAIISIIYDNIKILLNKLKIQDRLLVKIPDYEPTSAFGSLAQIRTQDRILEQLSLTTSNDVIMADIEDDISVIQSQVISYKDILQNLLIFTVSYLLQETDKTGYEKSGGSYKNKQVLKENETDKKNIKKLSKNTYRSLFENLFYKLLQQKYLAYLKENSLNKEPEYLLNKTDLFIKSVKNNFVLIFIDG